MVVDLDLELGFFFLPLPASFKLNCCLDHFLSRFMHDRKTMGLKALVLPGIFNNLIKHVAAKRDSYLLQKEEQTQY